MDPFYVITAILWLLAAISTLVPQLAAIERFAWYLGWFFAALSLVF